MELTGVMRSLVSFVAATSGLLFSEKGCQGSVVCQMDMPPETGNAASGCVPCEGGVSFKLVGCPDKGQGQCGRFRLTKTIDEHEGICNTIVGGFDNWLSTDSECHDFHSNNDDFYGNIIENHYAQLGLVSGPTPLG
ncbi:hypothetical protein E3Q10_04113 [Wallemia mellicola]|uniref:Uncharacterized protein n=2 Tax=Wallemia mellicola TaxID=1708541 RepID=A0A4T0PC10_9BASI|nr:hypothetical protein E3Q24_03865 [Wallemia mellicola]TIB79985.1 hypothetical protein E3Q21_03969 [Wallemia mellicola]TIB83983.1 hypothetical protein E3Q20_03898 [Wallemia mellicola]TIC08072.1 hypothetical protein E3Q14_04025 [Wallemia mellicola]TIC20181.1 hypothetical protein E3Q12_03941 [Wallemia mellicola]